jgi:HemY protein
MAELEMRDGDEGRAREWMTRALKARRDPAWTADGFVSDRWLPVSPVTGRLDAFEWKDPLAGEDHALEDHTGSMIEASDRPATLEPPTRTVLAPPPKELAPAESDHDEKPLEPLAAAEPRPTASDVVPAASPLASTKLDGGGEVIEPAVRVSQEPASQDDTRARAERLKPVPPVIPMVHAPDDPGPDTDVEADPAPTSEPPAASWSKIRQLFRS